MSKGVKQFGGLLLSALMIISMIPTNSFLAFASENDFGENHFSNLLSEPDSITTTSSGAISTTSPGAITPELKPILLPKNITTSSSAIDFSANFINIQLKNEYGANLPNPVDKDANIRVVADYQVPVGGLSKGVEYTFALPTAVTPQAETIDVSCGDDPRAGIVKVATNGNCTIEFLSDDAVVAGTEGEFFYSSHFVPSEIPNGTNELTFNLGPDGSINIPINFLLEQITAEVAVANNATLDTAKNLVKWEVSAEPTLKYADVDPVGKSAKLLENFTITNPINTNLTLLFNEADSTTYPTVLDENTNPVAGVTFEHTGKDTTTGMGGTLICTLPNGNWASGDKYKLNYNTTYDLSIFKDKDSDIKLPQTSTAEFNYQQYADNSSSNNIALGSAKSISKSDDAEATINGNLLSKESNYLSKDNNIEWTLKVNHGLVGFDSNFDVTDIIPAGLKVTKVTMDGVELTTTPIPSGVYYEYAPTNAYDSANLVIKNLPKNTAHTIVYITNIKDSIWQTNENAKFINSVGYTGILGGKGYGFSRTREQKCDFGGASGGFIGGSASYDTTNHTFTWDLAVNSNEVPLSNAVVEIKIPNGLTYGNITLSGCGAGANSSYDITTKTVTVTLPNIGADKGTIKLTTTVDDNKIWAANHKNEDFTLNTILKAHPINLPANIKSNTISKVISKTSSDSNGYNYNTKEITWDITFNQNKMAIYAPIIIDNLMAGLEYVDGSMTATNATIKPNGINYNKPTNKLKVEFEDIAIATSPASISFKTKVIDDELIKWNGTTNSSAEITNTASIEFTGMPTVDAETSLSSTVTRFIGKRPLVKTGTQNKAMRNYTWTIHINNNQITLDKPVLEDNLPTNLIMDLDSVKLYTAICDPITGELTKGTEVYNGETNKNSNYTASLSGQKFAFKFNGVINTPYILTFDTDNLNPYPASYSNSVLFADMTSSTNGTSQIQQGAANGGSTNQKRGTIKLIAKDNSTGAPLANVQYTIKDTKTGLSVTVKTNSNGVALFTPLKFDTYTITEDLSLVSPFAPLQTLPTVVISAYGEQSITLKYQKGLVLLYDGNTNTGGITPTQQNYIANSEVTTLATNPFSKTGYDFVAWNTKSDGTGTSYTLGSKFTITADTTLYAIWRQSSTGGDDDNGGGGDSGTGNGGGNTSSSSGSGEVTKPPVVSNPSGWTSKITANTTNITKPALKENTGGLLLTAVSNRGSIVTGVVFEITINGEKITVTTDKNGVALFPDIPDGTYEIKVLSVPKGYEFDFDKTLTAKVVLGSWIMAEAQLGVNILTPNTGDNTPLIPMLTLALLSLSVLGGMIYFRRKS